MDLLTEYMTTMAFHAAEMRKKMQKVDYEFLDKYLMWFLHDERLEIDTAQTAAMLEWAVPGKGYVLGE